MADKRITERLQPSLLDRLRDDAPHEDKETSDKMVINLTELRDIIRRDLSWLLNSNNNETLIDEDRYPHTTTSTLNFGVREVAGDYSTQERVTRIKDSMQRAIARFEPRVQRGSLSIEPRVGEKDSEAVIEFDIRANMWAQPLPRELYLRSRVDLTTGELSLE